MMNNLVEVVGPIGSGKTSIAQAIAKFLREERGIRVDTYPELLPKDIQGFQTYYSEMAKDGPNRFALGFQLTMSLHAFTQGQNEIVNTNEDDIAVWEVGPFGHFMYAYCQYLSGKLVENDFARYLSSFCAQLNKMPLPQTLLVTLIEDVIIQRYRISERVRVDSSRAGELSIQDDYLEMLIAYWSMLLEVGGVLPITALYDNGVSEVGEFYGFKLIDLDKIEDHNGYKPDLKPETIELLKQIELRKIDPTAYDWRVNKDGEWVNPESALAFFNQLFPVDQI